MQELEQSRLLALENIQCSAAVTATMSKAKLLGLDKQIIEHKADSCVSIKVDFTDAAATDRQFFMGDYFGFTATNNRFLVRDCVLKNHG